MSVIYFVLQHDGMKKIWTRSQVNQINDRLFNY